MLLRSCSNDEEEVAVLLHSSENLFDRQKFISMGQQESKSKSKDELLREKAKEGGVQAVKLLAVKIMPLPGAHDSQIAGAAMESATRINASVQSAVEYKSGFEAYQANSWLNGAKMDVACLVDLCLQKQVPLNG